MRAYSQCRFMCVLVSVCLSLSSVCLCERAHLSYGRYMALSTPLPTNHRAQCAHVYACALYSRYTRSVGRQQVHHMPTMERATATLIQNWEYIEVVRIPMQPPGLSSQGFYCHRTSCIERRKAPKILVRRLAKWQVLR